MGATGQQVVAEGEANLPALEKARKGTQVWGRNNSLHCDQAAAHGPGSSGRTCSQGCCSSCSAVGRFFSSRLRQDCTKSRAAAAGGRGKCGRCGEIGVGGGGTDWDRPVLCVEGAECSAWGWLVNGEAHIRRSKQKTAQHLHCFQASQPPGCCAAAAPT